MDLSTFAGSTVVFFKDFGGSVSSTTKIKQELLPISFTHNTSSFTFCGSTQINRRDIRIHAVMPQIEYADEDLYKRENKRVFHDYNRTETR